MKITEKVIVFLETNPSKNDLTIDELLENDVISKEEYDFLLENKIEYNPPSSAGPYDNFISIFDREHGDGTSSHILYDIVDKTDTSITKAGDIDSLKGYLTEWYDFDSTNKTIYLFNNDNFYYLTIWYTDNEHWDKQHAVSIGFPESNNTDIQKFRDLLESWELEYREYPSQSDLNFRVMLPPNLSIINEFCLETLEKIFFVEKNVPLNYTPDGFRFTNG